MMMQPQMMMQGIPGQMPAQPMSPQNMGGMQPQNMFMQVPQGQSMM